MSMRSFWCWTALPVAVAWAAPLPVFAAARLVTDINSTYSAGATTLYFERAELAACTIIVLDDGSHGKEIWRTDGTPGGTGLLRDIRPGATGSDPEGLRALGNLVLFSADDGTNGRELWSTDCTAAGTRIVADIDPAAPSATTSVGHGVLNFGHAVELDGIVYFAGGTGANDVELWRTDGTQTGTWQTADIYPGQNGSYVDRLTVGDGRLYFVADDGVHGTELWISDGSQAGTELYADIVPGANGSDIREIAVVGGAVYAAANNGTDGLELWRGTSRVPASMIETDLNPGASGSAPTWFYEIAGRVLFFATGQHLVAGQYVTDTGLFVAGPSGDPDFLTVLRVRPTYIGSGGGRVVFLWKDYGASSGEPWTTDGTAAGTEPLLPGQNFRSSGVDVLTGSGELFFYAATGVTSNPDELWRTDGTPAGTYVQTDITSLPGPYGRGGQFAYLNGVFYHPGGAVSSAEGRELWRTFGNPAVSELLKDINPGPNSSSLSEFFVNSGRVMFTADDGSTGVEPWVTDGTPGGTVPLGDFNRNIATAGSGPSGLVSLNGGVFFTADDGFSGSEPWFSDGSVVGTQLLRDIATGMEPSWAGVPALLNGELLFSATDATYGAELWRSDGTPAGTVMVADINVGPGGSDPLSLGRHAVLGGTMYFVADDGVSGAEIWATDGTQGGTRLAIDVEPGAAGSWPTVLGDAGARLVFYVQRAAGVEIEGTDQAVTQFAPLAGAFMSIAEWVPMQGDVVFLGRDLNGVTNVWRTDGTAAGTLPITNLGSGTLAGLRSTDDRILFTYCVTYDNCSLYSSDGSANSESIIYAASALDYAFKRSADGTTLMFPAIVGGQPTVLVSDGRAAGTRLIVEGQAPFAGGIDDYVFYGSRALVSVRDAVYGTSIWSTDGTSTGTQLYAVIDSTGQYSAGQFTPAGQSVYFSAWQQSTGSELWVIDGTEPFASDDQAQTAFETQVSIAVLSNDGDIDGQVDPGSVAIVVAPVSGSAIIDATTGEIVYVPDAGFSGLDTLEYSVKDNDGLVSNTATVSITVAAEVGGQPGTSPPPPPPPPAPAPSPSPAPSGSGGGGGAFGLAYLCVLLVLAVRRSGPRFRRVTRFRH